MAAPSYVEILGSLQLLRNAVSAAAWIGNWRAWKRELVEMTAQEKETRVEMRAERRFRELLRTLPTPS
jgi:hypothetical protein